MDESQLDAILAKARKIALSADPQKPLGELLDVNLKDVFLKLSPQADEASTQDMASPNIGVITVTFVMT